MTEPYRDENETLRAENARLRSQLDKRRGAHRLLSITLLALDFAAVIALRPWLNGESDAKFWCGLVIIGGIAVAAVVTGIVGRRRA
jgi:hypothetical protein